MTILPGMGARFLEIEPTGIHTIRSYVADTISWVEAEPDEGADVKKEPSTDDVESEQAAMAELTAENCGDGLDFASVVAAGEANLTEGDKLAIKAAKDPAAEKYRRCVMLSPELSAKAETVRTNRLLENI
ncbi:MAG: hypothetical protein ABFR50_11080, partial [Candidatus Fermentibacteria bacterium]